LRRRETARDTIAARPQRLFCLLWLFGALLTKSKP